MASGIHTVSPRSNVNLIKESLVYTGLSRSEFTLHNFVDYRESGEFSKYNHNQNVYDYENNINQPEHADIPLNLIPVSHVTIVSCNNNIVTQDTEEKEKGLMNGSQEYESDESSISASSREISEHKGTKCKNSSSQKKTTSDFRPRTFQPNLYQPIVGFHKSSKSYYRGGHRKFLKNSEETERKVHGLMRRFQSRSHKMKIDVNPKVLLNGGPWDLLNQAIWDVFVNKIQKEQTYINKLNLWKTIFLLFKMCLSNYGLYMVGSTMSGFALDRSDIDICLLTKPFSNEPRVDSLHHLNYLQNVLLKNGLASEAELVMAKVPILKFKNKDTGFEIDLNCNNMVGIQNTHLLYCYSQLDWRVRPLVVIVKIWAQANNINDAKNMTVSSYSWTLMVIHYLQCGVFPPVLPCLHTLYPEEFSSDQRTMDVQGEVEGLKNYESENTRCLGDLLIVRTGSRLPIEMCKQVKSPKNDPHQWKYLCIEEPFDLSNTARSVFDPEIFKHIRQIILASYKELAGNKALSRILPVMHLNGQR